MKKTILFVCICFLTAAIIAIGTVVAVNKANMDSDAEPANSKKAMETSDNGIVSLTITAVGDCTLGTDVKFGVGSGFCAEVVRQKEDYSYFMKNVKHYFENDDLTIVNFEGTLTDRGVREPKQFAFKGEPEYVNILTSSSIEAANLANNHSRDYGEISLKDTKKILKDAGVAAFGMDDIAIVDIKGVSVGLIGTNALNYKGALKYPDIFQKLIDKKPDLIIANFHWGAENAAVAALYQVNLAHEAIDKGADLVIGHHPHVLQGIEKYKDRYIVYSLGNFCFGGNSNPRDKDSMIFQQTFLFEDGKLDASYDDVSVIPCRISSVSTYNNYQPTPYEDNDFIRVKNKILSRSAGYAGTENINFISQ